MGCRELKLCDICGEPLQPCVVIDGEVKSWHLHDHARWRDAPTCEGWWWYKTLENPPRILIVARLFDCEFVVIYPGEGDCEMHALDTFGGRWFGPLMPPEG